MAGEAHQFAHFRRAAARHEGLREARQVLQFRHGRRPLVGDDARHRMAALGDFDGRLHQIGKRQRTEFLMQRLPARNHARHGHRVPAALGLLRETVFLAVLALEVVDVPRRRRHARRVQAVQLRAVPHQRERIAAETARDRLDHRDGRGRRDRRVDRIAALPQHAQAGLRGERMRSRNDVAREYGQARCRIRVLPVEAGHVGDSRKARPGAMHHAGTIRKRITERNLRLQREPAEKTNSFIK